MIFASVKGNQIDLSNCIRIDTLNEKIKYQGIYIIINIISHKIYIGQSVNVRNRWLSHCEIYANQQAIDKAIKKYGKNNFQCYLLENVENRADLNDREFYWAKSYSECYSPFGYNVTLCGNQVYSQSLTEKMQLDRNIVVSAYDPKNGQRVKTYPSLTAAVKAEKANGIMHASTEEYSFRKINGYYWRRSVDDFIDVTCIYKPKTGPNGGKDVFAYDLITGDFIIGFSDAIEAVQWLGNKASDTANISAAALGKINYAYNYYWSYDRCDNIFELRPELALVAKQKLCSYVSQYSLEGDLLNIYPSSVVAARETGLRPANIGNCCTGLGKTHGGFKWKYTFRDELLKKG